MELFTRMAFNVLFNAALSFFAAVLIVTLVWLALRPRGIVTGMYLLSLPFLKLAFDVLRGVPDNSYVFRHGLDFFDLPTQLGRNLSIAAWWHGFGPGIGMRLGIFDRDRGDATLYSVSAPDVIANWLENHLGFASIVVIVGVCLAISIARVTARVVEWATFSRRRRADEKNCVIECVIRFGYRTVRVYTTEAYDGGPFTGGLVRPYICIPNKARLALTQSELDAVLAHELRHVKHFDLIQSMVIQLLGDVFWFVPGYRTLSRKLEAYRELAADRISFDQNQRDALATALLALAPLRSTLPRAALYAALIRKPALLEQRVGRLVEAEPPPSRLRLGLTLTVCIWTTIAVLCATFVNNYDSTPPIGAIPASVQR